MRPEARTPELRPLLSRSARAALFAGGVLLVGVLLGCMVAGWVPVTALGTVFIGAWVLVLVGYLRRSRGGRAVLWASLGVACATAAVAVAYLVLVELTLY